MPPANLRFVARESNIDDQWAAFFAQANLEDGVGFTNEIDEAVGRKAGSKRLGGNPIDLDIVIGSRAIEKSVTNPSPNNERTPTGV